MAASLLLVSGALFVAVLLFLWRYLERKNSFVVEPGCKTKIQESHKEQLLLPLFILDKEFKIIEAPPIVGMLLGCPSEELIGRFLSELIVDSDLDALKYDDNNYTRKYSLSVCKESNTLVADCIFSSRKMPDEMLLSVDADSYFIFDEQTQQKRTGIDSQLLDLSLTLSNRGCFFIDYDRNEFEFNKSWLPGIGYNELGPVQGIDNILSLLSPLDKERVALALEKRDDFDLNYRMTTSKGEELWLNAVARKCSFGGLIGIQKIIDNPAATVQEQTEPDESQADVSSYPVLDQLLDDTIKLYKDHPIQITHKQFQESPEIEPEEWAEVVRILLDNALESTMEESNRDQFIHVNTGTASFDLEQCAICGERISGMNFYLSVVTFGVEIARPFLPFLFDRTFTTRTVAEKGETGLYRLGKLLHANKGHAMVIAESDRTEFRIFLAYSENNFANTKRSFHVLVVDDHDSVLVFLTKALKEEEVLVTGRADANAAIEYLRTNSQRIDLLITDLQLPDMAGEQLVKVVKEISPNLPVVLCSGADRQKVSEIAGRLDAYGYLGKPVNMTKLLKMIDSLRT